MRYLQLLKINFPLSQYGLLVAAVACVLHEKQKPHSNVHTHAHKYREKKKLFCIIWFITEKLSGFKTEKKNSYFTLLQSTIVCASAREEWKEKGIGWMEEGVKNAGKKFLNTQAFVRFGNYTH